MVRVAFFSNEVFQILKHFVELVYWISVLIELFFNSNQLEITNFKLLKRDNLMNYNVVKALFGGISVLMITGCSQDPVSVNNENNTSEYFASTNQFGNRTSTYNGVGIKIFETNPLTHGIDVAVYTDNNKKTINNTTLAGLNDQQISAKVNCSFMQDRSSSGDAFYGINYTKQKLYMNGKLLDSPTDSRLSQLNNDNQFYPSFCIRTDWSTAIRWPKHDDGSQNANYCIPATVKACRTIIGSGHALVYEGKNVFTQSQPVNDNQGYPIYISDNSANDRFNHIIGEPFSTTTRTLFGQKSDNAFLMVVVEQPGL